MCVSKGVRTHACDSASLFGLVKEEYLNSSLINIRREFIGFEAFLPFVKKHKTIAGSWQSGRVVLFSGSQGMQRKSTLTLTGCYRKCFWIKLTCYEGFCWARAEGTSAEKAGIQRSDADETRSEGDANTADISMQSLVRTQAAGSSSSQKWQTWEMNERMGRCQDVSIFGFLGAFCSSKVSL